MQMLPSLGKGLVNLGSKSTNLLKFNRLNLFQIVIALFETKIHISHTFSMLEEVRIPEKGTQNQGDCFGGREEADCRGSGSSPEIPGRRYRAHSISEGNQQNQKPVAR